MNSWYENPVAAIDEDIIAEANARQAVLTKPPGALGVLESLAVRFAGWQGRVCPVLNRTHIVVFAGDHGIAQEGVSAFPQAVTQEMIRNFSRGGAAISVLSRHAGANLLVVNVGTVAAMEALPGVLDRRVGAGTASFLHQPAMTGQACLQAMQVGRDIVQDMKARGAQLFVGGEMGIANTSSATALACALLELPASELTGAGTGLDEAGVARKTAVLDAALARIQPDTPLKALCEYGGFEIAALAGAYLASAQNGIPILVDGFITTAAALVAVRLNPDVRHWMLFSHCSAEGGHRRLLDALSARPLLQLDMRLGEASGAAMALSTIRQALLLHAEMATFAEAAVSTKL